MSLNIEQFKTSGDGDIIVDDYIPNIFTRQCASDTYARPISDFSDLLMVNQRLVPSPSLTSSKTS